MEGIKINHHFVFSNNHSVIGDILEPQYDYGLVTLSILLAIFSSYVAFLVSGRINSSDNKNTKTVWLAMGVFSLSVGIWAMHFIGMLAYKLFITVNYDVALTVLSFLPAMLASLVFLRTPNKSSLSLKNIVWKSLFISGGIALMHYIGMSAMQMNAGMFYDIGLFILSLVIAFIFAAVSIWFKFQADKHFDQNIIFNVKLILPSIIMGGAISGMHYTGMAAMTVYESNNVSFMGATSWSNESLVKVISIITVFLGALLIIALEVSHRISLYIRINKSEEKVRLLLDATAEAIYGIDTKGNCTFVNKSCLDHLGYDSESELLGLNMHKLIHHSYSDGKKYNSESCKIGKALNEEKEIHIDNEVFWRKDGNSFSVEYWSHPIFENKKCTGAVVTFFDITEKIKAEKKINENAANLKSIASRVPGMVYQFELRTDGTMHFPYISDAINDVYQLSVDEVQNDVNKIFEVTHPDDIEKLNTTIIESAENLIPWKLEYRIRMKDGSERWLFGNSLPEKRSDGSVLWHGFVTDITKNKETDEMLKRTQKMDALGKLTGGIAHDYNNMLGVILGYSELLSDTFENTSDQKSYLDQIIRAGNRGTKLTSKLLSFSRKASSNITAVDINVILNSEKLLLEKTLTARIKLEFVLEDNLWFAYLDHDELEDVILNLSINAMHAMEGGGSLVIETSNKHIDYSHSKELGLEVGDYVQLSVLDSGCGIDNDTKEKVFDPFFSTKGDKGTGLGLTQVYGFMKRCKGAIKIESKINKGSKFILYFPRYHDTNVSDSTISEDTVYKSELNENKKILIVDDEVALLRFMNEVLKEKNFTVYQANGGKEALDILENETIDLLISDVVMPEMDGYELSAIVKEKYPLVRIQLTSGYTGDNNTRVDPELFKNLLKKPYSRTSLFEKIDQVFNS